MHCGATVPSPEPPRKSENRQIMESDNRLDRLGWFDKRTGQRMQDVDLILSQYPRRNEGRPDELAEKSFARARRLFVIKIFDLPCEIGDFRIRIVSFC